MQLKLAAARDVLSRWPDLYKEYGFHTKTDDEIKANLILNESFNIEVGARYLLLLKQTYGFSGKTLLNAYNRGPGGVTAVDDSYHYAVGAERKLAAFKVRN
jgi:soluble lytic murein transglycosylase-like protein